MTLNVDGSNDAFYRYKMPKLYIKVEGKGNGIKTVLSNICDIAKALSRKPEYPTKYFAMELGAQSIIDKKTDRYIVNGSHEVKHLQDMLTGFIQKFVLCESCSNPETVLSVKKLGKSGIVLYNCHACGSSGELNTKHKLTQYICKNPPVRDSPLNITATDNTKESGETEDNAELLLCDGMDGGGAVHVKAVDSINPSVELVTDENVAWAVDGSQRAVLERMKELNVGAQRLIIKDEGSDAAGTTKINIDKASDMEKATVFSELIDKMLKDCTSFGARPIFSKDNIRELYQEFKRLKLSSNAVLCIMEKLFDNADSFIKDVEANKLLLATFARDEESEQFIIIGIYLIIDKFIDKLLSVTSQILNVFYRCDILSEKMILQWHEKRGPSSRYMDKTRGKKIMCQAKAFLDFLNTADSESSDEEIQSPCESENVGDSDEGPMKSGVKAILNNSLSDDSEVDIDNL